MTNSINSPALSAALIPQPRASSGQWLQTLNARKAAGKAAAVEGTRNLIDRQVHWVGMGDYSARVRRDHAPMVARKVDARRQSLSDILSVIGDAS